jgi:ABC-type glucose/galactose transport system permease subunit
VGSIPTEASFFACFNVCCMINIANFIYFVLLLLLMIIIIKVPYLLGVLRVQHLHRLGLVERKILRDLRVKKLISQQ